MSHDALCSLMCLRRRVYGHTSHSRAHCQASSTPSTSPCSTPSTSPLHSTRSLLLGAQSTRQVRSTRIPSFTCQLWLSTLLCCSPSLWSFHRDPSLSLPCTASRLLLRLCGTLCACYMRSPPQSLARLPIVRRFTFCPQRHSCGWPQTTKITSAASRVLITYPSLIDFELMLLSQVRPSSTTCCSLTRRRSSCSHTRPRASRSATCRSCLQKCAWQQSSRECARPCVGGNSRYGLGSRDQALGVQTFSLTAGSQV